VKKIFMIIMSIIFLLYLIHAYMSEKKTKQNLPSQEQKIQVR
jgi:cbb3-type cytochrome oxidase subunit 3